MSFPSDIKNCMRDCILSVMWAKKDIYMFFEDHCTSSDIRVIKNYKEEGLKRNEMVSRVFSNLSKRTDNGIGAFRAMLQSLINWSNFNSYYFDNLKKLDRDTANKNIEHLRQLQELRDEKLRKERQERAERNEDQQRARQSIEELKTRFLNWHSGKGGTQQRGYDLERILLALARLSELEVTEPFRVDGEQIDGAIKYDGEHYLIEAKWQDKSSSNEPVYQFVGKVEGKMYGRGIFVSINGFSDHVVKSIVKGKALKTIFVDVEDLIFVIEERLTFKELIDVKVKAAQTKGHIYIHPITEKSKIKE